MSKGIMMQSQSVTTVLDEQHPALVLSCSRLFLMHFSSL